MKAEKEPVTEDEVVLRLVWHTFLMADRVSTGAFQPKPGELTGISVFRAACLTAPADALQALDPTKRGGHGIAALPVRALVGLGLTVEPVPIASVPGHAHLSELNAVAATANKVCYKSVLEELSRLVYQNILLRPAPPAP